MGSEDQRKVQQQPPPRRLLHSGIGLGVGMGSVSIVSCESADRKRWRGCDGDFSPGGLYFAGAWNLCVSVHCGNRRTLSLLPSFSLLGGVATAVSLAPVQA